MGAWGTAIFSNDTSADVRGEFRDLIADGLDPRTATERLVASYEPGLGLEDACDFWLGLAVAQHRLGRLLPEVHEAAVSAAAAEDLRRWQAQDRDKRVRAVDKALQELAAPQPEPKAVRRPPANHTDLEQGQHFLYEFRGGRRVLFRVAEVDGGTPRLLLLSWSDTEAVPTGQDLLQRAPVPARDGREGATGFVVYGSKDPSSRITLLPERLEAPRSPRRRRLPWWLRRSPAWSPSPWLPVVSWRALPTWFTDDGDVREPAG